MQRSFTSTSDNSSSLPRGSAASIKRRPASDRAELGCALVNGGLKLLIIGGAVGREGRLAALRIEDGFVTWETGTAAPIRAACIDPQRAQVIVGTEDGAIVAYDVSVGRLRWMTQTRGAVRSMPSVDCDGRCFAGSLDGLLYALDGDSGRQLWTRRLGGFVDSAPLVVGDLVVAGAPTHLVALDWSNATIRWVAATGGRVAGAVVAGEAALIGESTGFGVYVLDRESGSAQSRYTTDGAIRSRPAVGGNLCAVSSSDGKLYGFRVGDAWRTPAHPTERPY